MDTCWRNDQIGEPATGRQSVDESCACGNIKNVIADKIHKVAAAVGKRAASQDAQPAMVQHREQATEIMDESAEYMCLCGSLILKQQTMADSDSVTATAQNILDKSTEAYGKRIHPGPIPKKGELW